jgi:hypothetical protein
MYWQVTSAGGREHFLIFVSPEPLKEFEKTFASLALPNTNEPSSARDCPSVRSACCAASAVSSRVLRERKNPPR